MDREVIISLEALNQAVKYLAERPYKEVTDLIDTLKAGIREIPDEQEKETQNPDPIRKTTEKGKPKGFGDS